LQGFQSSSARTRILEENPVNGKRVELAGTQAVDCSTQMLDELSKRAW